MGKIFNLAAIAVIVALAVLFGTLPKPAFADTTTTDPANCGFATAGASVHISPAGSDILPRVQAIIGGWKGDWKLEGSNETSPSAIAFTSATTASVDSVYVFNGLKQLGPGKFDVLADGSLKNTTGSVTFVYELSADGQILTGTRTQGTIKATAKMFPCMP